MIETDSDRAQYLSDYGNATITLGVDTFTTIFNHDLATANGVQRNVPNALLTSVDVETYSVVKGSAVTIRAVDYTVRELRPDNEGFYLLILEQQ